ncbi:MAG: HEPN domain-containing protein [Chloroflexi bacterium]|nr:HEPN domain-containing protein [Chloroflexota bacterium]MDL1940771.1 HEPN domain-containing protein [Chloroflexi bacterium CFX2]
MNPDDAKIWLRFAESDLRAARTLLESGEFFPRQVCFFAQQCGEKALKAILVFEDVFFPKNHDLDRLRDLIPDSWKVKKKFPDLAELTVWAVESRYPGHSPDATEGEARDTLRLAEALFNAISAELDERIQQDEQDNFKD